MVGAGVVREWVVLTTGDQTSAFVYVGDLVEAILLALVQPKGLGKVFNVCSGEEISIKAVALMIRQLCGSTSKINFGVQPYRPGESMHFFGSNKKIGRLGWHPATGLKEGLELAIAWQR